MTKEVYPALDSDIELIEDSDGFEIVLSDLKDYQAGIICKLPHSSDLSRPAIKKAFEHIVSIWNYGRKKIYILSFNNKNVSFNKIGIPEKIMSIKTARICKRRTVYNQSTGQPEKKEIFSIDGTPKNYMEVFKEIVLSIEDYEEFKEVIKNESGQDIACEQNEIRIWEKDDMYLFTYPEVYKSKESKLIITSEVRKITIEKYLSEV